MAYNRWKGNTGEDTTGPTTHVPQRTRVRRGRVATFCHRVNDSQSPSAVVTLKIKTIGGRIVHGYSLGPRSTNRQHRLKFRCRLPRRTYRIWVYGWDESGNRQRRTGSSYLIVI